MKTTGDLVDVMGAIVSAIAAGVLTPDEGAAVATVVEAKRKAIETLGLEQRIAALEQSRK